MFESLGSLRYVSKVQNSCTILTDLQKYKAYKHLYSKNFELSNGDLSYFAKCPYIFKTI